MGVTGPKKETLKPATGAVTKSMRDPENKRVPKKIKATGHLNNCLLSFLRI